MREEKRREQRYSLETAPINVLVNNEIECRLLNISKAGVGLRFLKKFNYRAGEIVPVHVTWEDEQIDFTSSLKIIWVITDCIGAMFVGIDPEQTGLINKIIDLVT